MDTIIRVQRDHGDRHDREHARLKYLIHEWGIDRFGAEVAHRLGRSLPAPEPVVFEAAADHLGWHPQGDGRWFLGVKVENGRIADRAAVRVRSGLRAVVERFPPGTGGVRLNDVFAENVPRDELINVLRPVLTHYRAQRRSGERFGDFCHRLGVDPLRAQLGTERWARKPRYAAKENINPS